MIDPILHTRTDQLLKNYIVSPAHGLLLIGPKHIGKLYIAKWLAKQLHTTPSIIEPQEKNSITIAQIRELYSATKTDRKQVIIIDDASHMTIDAQNAFLKLLEEPPTQTFFILTATEKNSILPTIRSRTQHIHIYPPTGAQLQQFFNSEDPELNQLLAITGNKPALIHAALDNEHTKNTLLSSMKTAKKFYTGDSFERHQMLIEAQYEPNWVSLLLQNISLILQALISTRATDNQTLRKLSRQASLTTELQTLINNTNVNFKIQLTQYAELL